jgi:hypothetical protein
MITLLLSLILCQDAALISTDKSGKTSCAIVKHGNGKVKKVSCRSLETRPKK